LKNHGQTKKINPIVQEFNYLSLKQNCLPLDTKIPIQVFLKDYNNNTLKDVIINQNL